MNILYIDHYAGSKILGRSFRPYYLGQEWIKKGCKLTVVSASYSHLRNINPNPGITYDEGICYIWLWTPEYQGNGIGRIFSMIIFTIQLFLNIPKIIRISQANRIIASTVYMLDIIPAWVIKKLLRTSPMLIFELHDIWPMSPIQIGSMSKYNPYIIFLMLIEKLTYKICDKVASILPNSFDHISQFGLKEKQIFYVPNGINLKDWENNKIEDKHCDSINSHLDALKNLKQKGLFLLGYTGAHTRANSLCNLIDAAKLLKKSSNIHIVFIGNGAEKDLLQDKAKKNNLNNITFLEAVSKKNIPEILELFDLLYMGLHNFPVYQYGISPNKIFDYMMSSKPIISAIDSKFNPIRYANCGFHVESNNPEALANMIEYISVQPRDKLDDIGARGKIFVQENHSYEKIADKFLISMEI